MTEKPVALVTGAAGFCGRHLVSCLLDSGFHVVGFDRRKWTDSSFALFEGDITDTVRLEGVLRATQPEVIFHLAALTNQRLGFQDLHRVNAVGTLSLLDAAYKICPDASILLTSSSAIYGHTPSDALPISEEQPFHPVNFYAVSKVVQEMLAYQQFAQHALRVIRTRAFNLTGPGENAHFVASAFARQIAEIESGLREPVIEVGNLDSVRDFTDVRDAVRAYCLLIDSGEAGEVYNVCSGQGTRIRQLLDILLGLCRVPGISVHIDPSRLQSADVPVQVGDPARLHKITGWKPVIPLQQTLHDVLNFWRQRVSEGK